MTADVERSTDDDVVAIPLRHPWRWIAAAAVVVVLGLLFNSIWTNENIAKQYIWQYIFDPRIIKGVWIKGMQVLEENPTELLRLYTRRCIGQLPFHGR